MKTIEKYNKILLLIELFAIFTVIIYTMSELN